MSPRDPVFGDLKTPMFTSAAGADIESDPFRGDDNLVNEFNEYAAQEESPLQEVEDPIFGEGTPEIKPAYKMGRVESAVGSAARGFGSMVASIPKAIAEGAVTIANKFGDDPIFGNPEGLTPEDTWSYRVGQAIEDSINKNAPVNSDYSEDFWTSDAASAAGSMFGFMAGGAAAALLKAPAVGTVATMGAAAGGVEGVSDYKAVQEANNIPIVPADRSSTFMLNAVVGVSEAAPISQIFKRFDKLTGGGVSKILKEGFTGGIEELTQEVFQQVARNQIAKNLVQYDKERDMWEGAKEGGEVGFTIGFLMNTIAATVGLKRGMGKTAGAQDSAPVAAEDVIGEDPDQVVDPVFGDVKYEETFSKQSGEYPEYQEFDDIDLTPKSPAIDQPLPNQEYIDAQKTIAALEGEQAKKSTFEKVERDKENAKRSQLADLDRVSQGAKKGYSQEYGDDSSPMADAISKAETVPSKTFKTKKSAELHIKSKKLKQHLPVKENGKWIAKQSNFVDGRLENEDYRLRMSGMADEMTVGGGITLIPGEKEGEFSGRTKSINPEWAKSILSEESTSVESIQTAIEKALKADTLGVKQARIVGAILDAVDAEKTGSDKSSDAYKQFAYDEFIEGQREKAKALREYGKNSRKRRENELMQSYDEDAQRFAGELYEEDTYSDGMEGESRSLLELTEQAVEAGATESEVENLLQEFDSSSNKKIASLLFDLIEKSHGKRNQADVVSARGADAIQKEQGSESYTEKTEVLTGTEGGGARPQGGRGRQEVDQDLFGGKDETKQAILNKKLARQKKMDRAPEMHEGAGDLFSDKGKQAEIDIKAHEAASSPTNDLPEPTEAQIEADNYKKGHPVVHGIKISIENPKGSVRRGKDKSGKEWSNEIMHHYGDVLGTIGADGDPLDVFLSDDAVNTDHPVFIIDQVNPKSRRFDEHKIMIGFPTDESARKAYLSNYDKGWNGIGGSKEYTIPEFKDWLDTGDHKKRVAITDKQKGLKKKVAEAAKAEPLEGELYREGDFAVVEDIEDLVKIVDIQNPSEEIRQLDDIRDAKKLADILSRERINSDSLSPESLEPYSRRMLDKAKPAKETLVKKTPVKKTPEKKPSEKKPAASKADKKTGYGKDNKVFTEDAAEKARAVLKAKLNNLTSGFDPELAQAGLTLAGYHIEAGTRKFSDFTKAMIDDIGESIRPYIRGFYENARYYPGIDNTGMTSAEDIDSGASESVGEDALQSAISSAWDNGDLSNNANLKSIVAKVSGVKSSEVTLLQMKEAQEIFELITVVKAREVVADNLGDEKATFDKLLKLYQAQPNLSGRTSTSIKNQAYSTPSPIAYMVGQAAGVTKNTSVYEPTAGNGMLLIAANPENAVVNELNKDRAAALENQGFDVTNKDASKSVGVFDRSVSSVVMNPPFGSIPEKVIIDGYTIKKIDHLIVARALEAMKDDGKATMIIGANKMPGVIAGADRIFFNWLYNHYNVTSHFEIDGKMYVKQGAAWPIRVLTINGRKSPDGSLAPQDGTIARLDNWKDIYNEFKNIDHEAGILGAADGRPDGSGAVGAVSLGTTGKNDGKSVLGADGGKSSVASGEQRKPAPSGEGLPAGARPDGKPAGGDIVSAESIRRDDATDQQDQVGAGEFALESEVDTAIPAEKPKTNKPARSNVAKTAYQNEYVAQSSAGAVDVLVPVNMKDPLKASLRKLDHAVGGIDDYLVRELKYKNTDELHAGLMGLQIDSVAAAIYNIKEKSKGVVIADQTGIGKGRQAAAVIRWAIRNGKTPVFVSKKPELFSDMYGDLADIGETGVKPFILNNGESITHGGKKLFATRSAEHSRSVVSIGKTGKLPLGRNALFTTYTQIASAQSTNKRSAVSALMENAVLVMDEAHNAAGDSNTGEFFRGLVKDAYGVTYLSATFAKRPDNLPLYYRTDISDAVDDISELIEAAQNGGVPLQSIISSLLTESGQMFRRERSYAGIQMKTVVDNKNKDKHIAIADKVTSGLRAIVHADSMFHALQVKHMDKQAKRDGKKAVGAGNRSAAGVDHSQFTSVVHNAVSQMLLGIKADNAADEAIASIKANEKAVIALDNTMGSFLNNYTSDNGIEIGDSIPNYDWRNVMSTALERSRRITIKDSMGGQETETIPLSKLSPAVLHAYESAEKLIQSLDLAGIPVSPIDWIRYRIEDAGYSVKEITGRNVKVSYSDESSPVFERVDSAEISDKVATTAEFNSGKVDALILNVAGSTGISLHASEKFLDQRVRHMIVVQAAKDINVFLQMLGRVFRTGQVVNPKFSILNTALPAEIRPTSVLSKKMKSSNAITSSNEESATSIEIPDIINKYGDQVVNEYLLEQENRDLARSLRVTPLENKTEEGFALKVTGRMALMPVETQKEFYSDVESSYVDLIEFLDKTGQNELKQSYIDLKAKKITSSVFVEGKNKSSAFGADAVIGEYSVKKQGKPPTSSEVRSELKLGLNGVDANEYAKNIMSEAETDYKSVVKDMSDRIEELNAERAVIFAEPDHKQTDIDFIDAKIDAANNRKIHARTGKSSYKHWVESRYAVGTTLTLQLGEVDAIGTVVNLKNKSKVGSGNYPFNSSKTIATIMVNSGVNQIKVPLSKLISSVDGGGRPIYTLERVYDEMANRDAREKAHIVTGNLISAYTGLNTNGRIVNFSDSAGLIAPGILMPKSFSIESGIRTDKPLRTGAEIIAHLQRMDGSAETKYGVSTRSGSLRVALKDGGIVISVDASRVSGAKFYLNDQILKYTGDFARSQSKMKTGIVPLAEAEKALDVISGMIVIYTAETQAKTKRSIAKPDTSKPSLKTGEVSSAIDSVIKSTSAKPEIAVIDSVSDLPKKIGAENLGWDSDTRGIFETTTNPDGKIWLIASNIKTAEEAKTVLMHELFGHYGLRGQYGTDADNILRRVYAHYGISGLKSIAKKYDFDLSTSEGRLNAAEEKLAEMAEKNESPTLLNKIVAMVRDMLRKLGVNMMLSSSDIKMILANMRNYVTTGKSTAVTSRSPMRSIKKDASERQEKVIRDLSAGEPIDKVFQSAFDLLRIPKITKAAMNQLEKTVVERKFNKDGFMGWANPVVEKARAGIIDRYGLTTEYIEKEHAMGAEKRSMLLEGREYIEQMMDGGMTIKEAEVFKDMIEGKDIPENRWTHLAMPIRKAIDDMGAQMVELGLLDAETFEKNRGSWLHRVYLSHESVETNTGKWVSKKLATRRARLQGDQLRMRGMKINLSMDRLLKNTPRNFWGIRKEKGLADKSLKNEEFIIFDRLQPIGEGTETLPGVEEGGRKAKVLERVYWSKTMGEPPAKYQAWENKGTWIVRDVTGDKVMLWRDFTKEERQDMGEILDARYVVAKSYMLMSNDIATGKFYRDVAKNPEWTWTHKDPPHADSVSKPTDVFGVFTGYEWVHVPETKLPGTNRPQWGALSGRYIRAEIWRDLHELNKMRTPGVWRKLLTQWKLNKTARNPVVHMNNVVSNLMLMDLADVRWRDLSRGLTAMKEGTEDYHDAVKNGVFGSSFIENEIRGDILDGVIDELKKNMGVNGDSFEGRFSMLMNMWTKLLKMDKKMTDIYQFEDEIFRMATYMRRLSQGYSKEDSARIARDQFLNYDIRAPWVNAARNTVLPFISYSYRAVPVIMNSIAERPWKLAKYFTMAYMINSLAYILWPGDEEEERRSMSSQMQGDTWIQMPRAIRLWKNEVGDPVFWDIRRFIPGGDTLDTTQGHSAMPMLAPLQMGGPIMLAAEWALNKQSFTGREITDANDTLSEKAGKTAMWAYRSWFPSAFWWPGSWYWSKISKAASGGRDVLGRDYSVAEAMSSSMGIKIAPHNVELGQEYHRRELNRLKSSLTFELKIMARDVSRGTMSKQDYLKEKMATEAKLMVLQERAGELFGR